MLQLLRVPLLLHLLQLVHGLVTFIRQPFQLMGVLVVVDARQLHHGILFQHLRLQLIILQSRRALVLFHLLHQLSIPLQQLLCLHRNLLPFAYNVRLSLQLFRLQSRHHTLYTRVFLLQQLVLKSQSIVVVRVFVPQCQFLPDSVHLLSMLMHQLLHSATQVLCPFRVSHLGFLQRLVPLQRQLYAQLLVIRQLAAGDHRLRERHVAVQHLYESSATAMSDHIPPQVQYLEHGVVLQRLADDFARPSAELVIPQVQMTQ